MNKKQTLQSRIYSCCYYLACLGVVFTFSRLQEGSWLIYVIHYLCLFAYCSTHIVLCFCFVCIRLVRPVLPVSLDCSFLIAPSVSSNVYLQLLQSGLQLVMLSSPLTLLSVCQNLDDSGLICSWYVLQHLNCVKCIWMCMAKYFVQFTVPISYIVYCLRAFRIKVVPCRETRTFSQIL